MMQSVKHHLVYKQIQVFHPFHPLHRADGSSTAQVNDSWLTYAFITIFHHHLGNTLQETNIAMENPPI